PPRQPHTYPTRRSSDLRNVAETRELSVHAKNLQQNPQAEGHPRWHLYPTELPEVPQQKPESGAREFQCVKSKQPGNTAAGADARSEEHTSELQSPYDLV